MPKCVEHRKHLTALQVRSLLSYDAKSGIFVWKMDHAKSKAGDRAGRIDGGGYRGIYILGYTYHAHRLAWLYENGRWPERNIDHINGIKDDDRIENLRDVPESTNIQNQTRPHANGSSGFLGVSKYGKKWRAEINKKVNNVRKKIRLGIFEDPKDAHEAYVKAKRRLHEGNLL